MIKIRDTTHLNFQPTNEKDASYLKAQGGRVLAQHESDVV